MNGLHSNPDRADSRARDTAVPRAPRGATIHETLVWICSNLPDPDTSYAQRQAEYIVRDTLGISREQLFLGQSKIMNDDTITELERVVARCRCGEPIAYVLGKAFFYSVELTLTPDTLIPRPDTEILVEEILRAETAGADKVFMDMGTGSGAIAAALLNERPQWRCVASDCSFRALQVASDNIAGSRLILCADRLRAVRGPFDFIVSNPPYIPGSEIEHLDPGVSKFEPRIALDGGTDGLDFYRYLNVECPSRLAPGGRMYLEIGDTQWESVRAILEPGGWQNVRLVCDLSGLPRVVAAERPHDL